MTRAALRYHLLRVGFSAGSGTHGSKIRFAGLMMAAAALTATFLSVIAAVATYDGRAQRDFARGWALSHRHPAAMVKEVNDSIGGVSHAVVYVVPLSSAIKPPPGLPRWPGPGEVFLSPELARVGVAEEIGSRYGRVVGHIGSEGLAYPNERFAYVRPNVEATREGGWFGIRRFGADSLPLGDSRDAAPIGQFLVMLLATLGFATMVLIVIAARLGSAARDRRIALLAVLGATWRHRALVNIGEAAAPAFIGAIVGTLPFIASTFIPLRLPATGFVVNPDDVRSWVWGVPTAVAVSVLVILLAVVLLHRTSALGRANAYLVPLRRVPRWRLFFGLLGLVTIAATPYMPRLGGFAAYLGGTALLWAALPSAAALMVQRLGEWLTRRGRHAGWVAMLIGGRWAVAKPGVIIRITASLIIGIGVLVQAQVWTSRLEEPAAQSRLQQSEIRDSVLFVSSPYLTPDAVAAFADGLPRDTHWLAVTQGNPDEPGELWGSCAELTSIGLECARTVDLGGGDLRARSLTEVTGAETGVRVHLTDVRNRWPEIQNLDLVLLSPIGTMDLAPSVKAAASQFFGVATVVRPGEIWAWGDQNLVAMARWVVLLVSVMMAILVVVMMLSAAAEFIALSRSLSPVAVLTQGRRFLMGIALWNLTVPGLVAVVTGAGVATWHGLFFVGLSRSGQFSWAWLFSIVIVSGMISLALGLAGGLSSLRLASRWRPVAD
ncbi:FtsX-like permease family protein [Sphaerimonospora cavernae]|uniref:FtsX-like permease family protein n=1 Tax=Sphaerimonospora cavernae TaxID=1740611 RepID=A0ABV6UB59_9ACTN